MNGTPALGLRANLGQFSLLVLINAFVGAMAGMERSILPLMAHDLFGIASRSAILSFLVTFGLAKAVSNAAAGALADRAGRKKVLVAGWLAGLPVPLVLMFAPSWHWIVAANALLGVNQGFCWSAAVIMKIDLAGPRRRGLAVGLNEFAGYLAVAAAAYATALLAASYGLRPVPLGVGLAAALCGLALSASLAKDTGAHVAHEMRTVADAPPAPVTTAARGRAANLVSCSQAGLITNLNDAVAWGLFPIHFALLGLPLGERGVLAGLYPATWGIVQLLTGHLSDRLGRKWLIAGGMAVQASALWWIAHAVTFVGQAAAAVLLGIGTAMVYPVLLSAVGDSVAPRTRGAALGRYRFWRDSGYAAGALLAGTLADAWSMPAAITAVGALTFGSGIVFALAYRERPPGGNVPD